MTVYLVRHAHAVDSEENPERPLSRRGRSQALTLGTFLKRSGQFEPAEFWHSPLARSRETAELLGKGLRGNASFLLLPELQPESDPRLVARRIKAATQPVAIVGHEPHLSTLATLLVAGAMDAPVFVMKKCSALALEGAGPHWSVRWHISPDLIA